MAIRNKARRKKAVKTHNSKMVRRFNAALARSMTILGNKPPKHAGGRPSVYGPDIVAVAEMYVTGYAATGDQLPSVAGLASALGLHRDTIYDWAADPKKAEFSDIVRRIATEQERALINGGLSEQFNPSFAKMMMGKHGYSDKVDKTVGNPDGSKLYDGVNVIGVVARHVPIDELDDVLDRLAADNP